MAKKIAIIGANEPLISHYLQTKKLGYEIHSFAWEEGAVCKPYADVFYPISFTEKEQILKICKKVGIEGVLSFTLESALPTVNYIAAELGLPCNDVSCVRFTSDKYSMRKQLQDNHIQIPAYKLVKTKDGLKTFEGQFPLIVKPIDSGGSRGVTKVYNITELNSAYERAIEYSRLQQVLVEQFIDGREFSVEFISHKGKHYPVAITDKITTGEPHYVELEHHQPADITAKQKKQILEITEATLNALQVYSSASHTEIKMDSKGDFYVIEMGARMGGDMIGSDLVKLSTSYDYVKGCLELACGDFTPPEIAGNFFSGIYFLSNQSRYVESYLSHPEDHHEIVQALKTGQEIKQLRESGDRNGYIIYQADKKFNILK